MKPRMKSFYMGFAEHCAQMSRAQRLQVGAVIVKDDNIVSFSWNGTPAGWDNVCEYKEWMDRGAGGWLDPEEIESRWPYEGVYTDQDGHTIKGRYALKTKPEVLHAEMNSLMKLAKSPESGKGASLFTTHSPCLECAKGIYQAGISEVFFRDHFRSDDGIKFLEKCGIKLEQCRVHD
jgi:dCMP deaminase